MKHKLLRSRLAPCVRPMRDALCLNSWHIDLYWVTTFGRKFPMTVARITQLPAYRSASIEIMSSRVNTFEHGLHVLRHEMLHLVLGDEFEECSAYIIGSAPKRLRPHFSSRWNAACERRISHMELMLDRMGYTPERLAKGINA